MKTILCYGDSLTWGSVPGQNARHPFKSRWPNVLASRLGESIEVVSDGLRGRTTAFDENTADCDRNGARILPTALFAHAPVDLMIVMLGSNDLQPHITGSAIAAKQGIRRVATIAHKHTSRIENHSVKVLIVAPPICCETSDDFYAGLLEGAAEQSKLLADYYKEVADELGCSFFDASSCCETSPIDGVHLNEENTIKLGNSLVKEVKKLLA